MIAMQSTDQNVLSNWINSGATGSMSYTEFRKLMDDLHLEGKVTGPNQDEHLLEYSKMNVHRMNRWDKHYTPAETLVEAAKLVTKRFTWLIITEGWCGDSAQIVPAVEKIAALNKNINTTYILRDEHPEIMDLFLTNGSKSIPIIVCLDDENNVLWKWGPRPAEGQELLLGLKAAGVPYEEQKERLHLWYARNKQQALEPEFVELLKKMS